MSDAARRLLYIPCVRLLRSPFALLLGVALGATPTACAGSGVATQGPAGQPAPTATERATASAAVAPGALDALRPRLVFGQPRLELRGEEPVAFSRDDALLAVGEDSGLVRIFDAASGAPLVALRAHGRRISLLVTAPAGGFVSGDASGELVLWSAGPHGWLDAKPTILASRHQTAVTSVSFSADGRTMVSADRDGNALHWDAREQRVAAQLDESEDSGDGVTVGRGAAAHYAVSADGTAALGWGPSSTFVLALADAKASRRRRVRGAVLDARADGAGFAVTIRDRSGATVLETVDKANRRVGSRVIAPPGQEPIGASARLQREEGRFVVSSVDATRAPWAVELEPSSDARLLVSSSGRRAIVVTAEGAALLDLDRRSAQRLRADRSSLGAPLATVRAGRELVVTDGSAVHLYDFDTGLPRGRLPLAASRLAVSSDGRRFAGVGWRAFVVEALTREIELEADAEDPSAISPDLSLLAKRSGAEVVVYRAEGMGHELTRIALGDRYPTLLAFAPDSRSLLVADAKGVVDRFEARTGKRLASRAVGRDLRSLVAWTDDGIFAAARTSGGGTALVRLDPSSLAMTDESPAGPGVARSPSGAWTAWRSPQGVRARKQGGASFLLPDRLGTASSLGFDPAEDCLYVGRAGAVEQWSLAELEASRTGVADDGRKPAEPPADRTSRKDAFGDGLPAHALRRFGTMRGVLGSEIEDVLVVGGHLWLIGSWGRANRWDPIAGVVERRIESDGTAGDRNTFVTPDERYVVSRGTMSLGVWSTETGAPVAKVERPDAKDDASALAPNGTRFVVGTEEGEIRIYGVPGLELHRAEPGAHRGRIQAIAYSPDGQTIASCGRFGVIRLAEAASGAEKRTITGPQTDEYAGASAVAFSPDGRTLYADLHGVRAYDVATGRETGEFAGWRGNLAQIAVSPNGALVAFGQHHDPATVWDARKRTKIATLETPDGGSAVAFSASGSELWVGGPDGVLRSFDTTTWTERGARPVHGRIRALAVVEQGRVLVSADQTGLVRSWDALTAAPIASRILDSYPSIATSAAGLFAESAGIHRIGPRTLADEGAAIEASGGGLAVAADGSFAALVDGHALRLVDLGTGASQEIRWGGGYVDAVAVEPNGRFVAAGGTNGAVRFFDRTGAELGAGRAGEAVRSVAFSPRAALLFVGARQEGSSPSYLALEAPSGRPRWRLDELAFSSSDTLGVSTDGMRLAYADHEAIHLLDAATGVEVGTLRTEDAVGAEAFAFAPDGKTLYASAGRTVLAWDLTFLP